MVRVVLYDSIKLEHGNFIMEQIISQVGYKLARRWNCQMKNKFIKSRVKSCTLFLPKCDYLICRRAILWHYCEILSTWTPPLIELKTLRYIIKHCCLYVQLDGNFAICSSFCSFGIPSDIISFMYDLCWI